MGLLWAIFLKFVSELQPLIDVRISFGLNFISLYTHVQNDNVINTNEQVNDIQNGIQKEVLGLMLTVSHFRFRSLSCERMDKI